MDIPVNLEGLVGLESEAQFESPTLDFGEKIRLIVLGETNEELSQEVIGELSAWQDDEVLVNGSWRDFVLWVWRKIVEWWNNLWK